MAKKKKRTYGSGTVFRRTGRDTWSIEWRNDGQRLCEYNLPTEKAARDRLAIILGDQAAGKSAPRGGQTLNDLAEPWLKEREASPQHRSAYDDRSRWELHVKDDVGRLKPLALTPARIRAFVISLNKTLKPGTTKLVIALLSSLFSDLIEDGYAAFNPCRGLSKKTRALMQSGHDPKSTPYLADMNDIIRLYTALYSKSPVVGTAYAIGALAGLRTGEVRALEWAHIDLPGGQLHVQVQAGIEGPRTLKDGESRVLPIQPALAPLLAAWREIDGGRGLVCKPLRQGGRRFLDDHTMGKFLREVVAQLGLGAVCSCCQTPAAWYEFTRHTYASQYVMAGGSIEDLSRTMGHSTTTITEKHYVHLRPGYYTVSARNRLTANFGGVTANSTVSTGGAAIGATAGEVSGPLADELAVELTVSAISGEVKT